MRSNSLMNLPYLTACSALPHPSPGLLLRSCGPCTSALHPQVIAITSAAEDQAQLRRMVIANCSSCAQGHG